jgi:hypothetical protein
MVHIWAIKNEMTFGINKCDTLVVNPIYFLKPVNYEDTSFFIGSNKLPKTDNYTYLGLFPAYKKKKKKKKNTYLGIPFNKFLSLKLIQSKLNSN